MTTESYSALIVGSGIESLKAAHDLASIGHRVVLIEEHEELTASIEDTEILPSGVRSLYAIHPLLMAVRNHPLIDIVTSSVVEEIRHSKDGFTAYVRNKPCYIDTELCCFCSRCKEICPVNRPGSPIKAVDCISDKGIPRAFFIDKRKRPPCQMTCPLGINVQGYVALIADGKFREALEIIRDSAPLVGILGRICHHPCEAQCRRGEVDEPIAICSLKRFVSDSELEVQDFTPSVPSPEEKYEEKVAIIGSGPAGLTAAWELTRKGYDVTIFEALSVVGGMLRTVIAEYRLPQSVLEREIDILKKMGIEIITNSPIGTKRSIDSLFHKGFQAVLVSTGADVNKKLGLGGETLKGVYLCVPFLKSINMGEIQPVGKRVVVIGGGNAAMESARTALRLGAEDVHVLYRRTREEMPGDKNELSLATEEGVKISYLVTPIRFLEEDDRLIGVKCICMNLGEMEPDGKRRPIPKKGSEFVIDADTAIVAIGQEPELSFIDEESPIHISRHSTIKVNRSYHTEQKGVFAAGDVVTGSATVSEAMGASKKAAASIHRYLRGEPWQEMDEPDETRGDYEPIDPDTPRAERPTMPVLKIAERQNNFSEVELGFTREQAMEEAKRCLQCGVCSECRQCEIVCDRIGAVSHSGIKKYGQYRFHVVLSSKPLDEEFVSVLPEERIFYENIDDKEQGLGDSLLIGAGLAGKAAAFLTSQMQVVPPRIRSVPSLYEDEVRAGLFLCSCNESIGTREIMEELARFGGEFQEVVHSEVLFSACHPDASRIVATEILVKGLTRVILAACSCCTLDMICTACNDQKLRCKGNLFNKWALDPSIFEMINLKNFLSTRKNMEIQSILDGGKSMIECAISRVKFQKKLPGKEDRLKKSVAVIGVTPEGVISALDLERMGYQVYITDERNELLEKDATSRALWDKDILKAINVGRIVYMPESRIQGLRGHLGNFQIELSGYDYAVLNVSAILFAGGYPVKVPLRGNLSRSVFTSRTLPGFASFSPWATGIPGIFKTTGTPVNSDNGVERCGAAAAAQVAALLRKSEMRLKNIAAQVNENLCRGCGQCLEVCPFGAIELVGEDEERRKATIIEIHCQGCGTCLSVCPTGAVDTLYKSEKQIEELIEVMLR
ncbi:MAG: FAD-dependent oxidoreductase [Thermodesulfobacteriota bacterium]|nr:FAD-dependent oxidoreductase [Thermodesulfobacteriota bacterium]